MSAEDLIPKLIQLIITLVGSGPWGWAIAGIIAVGGGVLIWYYRKQIRKAVQKITEKKRLDEQAKNPTDNQKAEDDALKSEEEIEEIIKKGDN